MMIKIYIYSYTHIYYKYLSIFIHIYILIYMYAGITFGDDLFDDPEWRKQIRADGFRPLCSIYTQTHMYNIMQYVYMYMYIYIYYLWWWLPFWSRETWANQSGRCPPPLYISICIYICISIYIYLSIYIHTHPHPHIHIYLYIQRTVSIYLSIHLYILPLVMTSSTIPSVVSESIHIYTVIHQAQL